MNKNVIILLLLVSTYQLSIAQISFEEQIIDQVSKYNGAWGSDTMDIDGDGDLDIVVGFLDAEKVVWYENTDGNGAFIENTIIASEFSAFSVKIGDLDNDGDNDIVVADLYGSISWFENTDGLGSFTQHTGLGIGMSPSIAIADIDGDGDNDIIASSEFSHTIVSYENTNGLGTFIEKEVILDEISAPRHIYTDDVDNDGNIDIIAALFISEIVWFKNDGAGNYGTKQYIGFVPVPGSVFVADINGDGYKDVLSGSFNENETAYWFKNIDGLGNFDSGNIITDSAGKITKVEAADMDKDGIVDVVLSSESRNSIIWYKNTDGLGTFSSELIIHDSADGAQRAMIADIDNDFDMDVVSISYYDSEVAWIENMDGFGNFSSPTNIHSLIGNKYSSLVDWNNDGDLDIITASYWQGEVFMYDNEDGLGNYSEKEVITTFDKPKLFVTDDVNSDGFNDLIINDSNNLTWYNPQDDSKHIIDSFYTNVTNIYIQDFDNDGNKDIMIYIWNYGIIKVYHNNGLGVFDSGTIINTEYIANSAYPFDIDNDGDIDIVAGMQNDDYYKKIRTFINNEGAFSVGQTIDIGTSTFDSTSIVISANDMDNDGDFDILTSVHYNDVDMIKLQWFENEGTGLFNDIHIISEDWMLSPITSLKSIDFDNDGDNDIVLTTPGEGLYALSSIYTLENIDGAFSSYSEILNAPYYDNYSISTGDVNNDNLIDIVCASSYENGANKVVVYSNSSVLGVNEQESSSIELYPNPVNSLLYIRTPEQINTIEVYNLQGQIAQQNYQNNTIDLGTLNRGVYVVNIETTKGSFITKIIKK